MGRTRGTRKERRRNGITGCMNGMLKLFDFRQGDSNPVHLSQAKTDIPSQTPAEDTSSSGTEAPRNSLETLPNSKDCLLQKDQHRLAYEDEDIPMGFEIFTRAEVGRKDSITPNMKTQNPNVVARLMGMEIFPDESETVEGNELFAFNYIHTKNKFDNRTKVSHPKERKLKELNCELLILGNRSQNIMSGQQECRSMPETPRISGARGSDVDHQHHRLSLQIQKENVSPFINMNYIDGGGGGPSSASPTSSASSSLRSLDTKRMISGASNAGNKTTSPRMVRSTTSNRSRFAKSDINQEDDAEQRPSNSTPSSSPRLRRRRYESDLLLNKTDPRVENQTQQCSPRGSLRPVRHWIQPLKDRSNSEARPAKDHRLTHTIKGDKAKFEVAMMRKISGGVEPSKAARKGIVTPMGKKIRESYVRVAEVNVQQKKKEGQKAICDSLVVTKKRGQSVIATTKKHSPGMLRTLSPVLTFPSPKCSETENHVTKYGPFGHHHAPDTPPSSSSSVWVKSSIPSILSHRTQLAQHLTKPKTSSPPLSHDHNISSPSISMYGYIKAILELMDVRCNTKVTFLHWYSPSHPLDPTIMAELDTYHHRDERHRLHDGGHMHDVVMPNIECNRRLAFELVDELLRERLKACLTMHVKPWMMMMMMGQQQRRTAMKMMTGKQLMHDVWMDVLSFPSKGCKFVHDIDSLVARDISAEHDSSGMVRFEGESLMETILFGLEQEIAESLVSEAVVYFLSLQSGKFYPL